MTTLYLGAHHASWLSRLDVPLFASRRTLEGRRTFPRAHVGWALDSGGFTELKDHGDWTITEGRYVELVRRFSDEIGQMEWAAPMDWMCEPQIVAKTGRSVREHQDRTVHNFLYLRYLAPDLPIIPVLQGWTLNDYLECRDLYARCGIDLTAEPLVGVGSVCRRGDDDEIVRILDGLSREGLAIHGFGVRSRALCRLNGAIVSADSMAWSFAARYEDAPMEGHTHKRCNNCSEYAIAWYERQTLEPVLA